MLEEVKEVHRRLEADGHQIRSDEELKNRRKAGIETRPPDAKDLLAKAEEYINRRVTPGSGKTTPGPGPRPGAPAGRLGS